MSQTSHVSNPGAVAPTEDTESKRERKLTEKGKGLLHSLIDSYRKRLLLLKQQLDEQIDLISSSEEEVYKLEAIELLKDTFSKYIRESEEFLNFLHKQRTEEASEEYANHEQLVKTYKQKVSLLFSTHSQREKAQIVDEPVSRKSKSKRNSRSSQRTSVEGSTLSQRKAKAEAAHVKLEYANREAELMKQKAMLEAEKLMKNAEIDALTDVVFIRNNVT